MSEQARLKSYLLTRAQVAPLEGALPKKSPDAWREIALSFFVTLLSLKNWREMREEQLAVKALEGMVEDLGGTQPYIPTGMNLALAEKRRETALEMLGRGESYASAGRAAGLTEARVRKIEMEERKKKQRATEEPGKPR